MIQKKVKCQLKINLVDKICEISLIMDARPLKKLSAVWSDLKCNSGIFEDEHGGCQIRALTSAAAEQKQEFPNDPNFFSITSQGLNHGATVKTLK